jgi:hypothetical protein
MRTWLIPMSVICLMSAGAPAQEPAGGPPPAVREACKADMEKFCKDVEQGGGRVKQCMTEHRKELSDSCREAIRSARAHKGNGPSSGGQPEPPAKSQ